MKADYNCDVMAFRDVVLKQKPRIKGPILYIRQPKLGTGGEESYKGFVKTVKQAIVKSSRVNANLIKGEISFVAR